ncbi:hypothetical protein PROP_01252 [Propionicimonas sp. T2.31MG-18]|uniref:hypothetical protein n=1 Tax=Propionicimonas sp. T2.31MG-18 TaxID=3157620 RepID=UPI0035E5B731
MRRTTWRHLPVAGLVLFATLALVGCQAGPQQVQPGSYRLYATSAGATVPQGTSLDVATGTVALTSPAGRTDFVVGGDVPEAVLCPPSGNGKARTLDKAMAVGDLTLARPAIFGDCGSTRPVRVTVVDLDTRTGARNTIGFRSWAEFCRVGDADC